MIILPQKENFQTSACDDDKRLHALQMKEQVGVYVGELLKPRFKTNAISKEDYKWVVRKTVEKVSCSTVWVGKMECTFSKAHSMKHA